MSEKKKKTCYFENLLAFLVLMGNEKILTKSPAYIKEKWNRYIMSDRDDEFKWGLDSTNQRLLEEYLERWAK